MNGTPRVLLFGGSGLLGQAVVKQLRRSSCEVLAPSRDELPLTDSSLIETFINQFQPNIVINAAAYTDVDGAETERELASAVNAESVHVLVQCAQHWGFRLIHVSTASVFTGGPDVYFAEDSALSPTNHYNATKAKAEELCALGLASGANVAWIRTYWLYGRSKPNFVDFIAQRLRTGKQVPVVRDQWGQPTLVDDLGEVIEHLALHSDRVGVVHAVNSGAVSRLEWALAVAEVLDVDPSPIIPVTAAEFSAPAKRPAACLLAMDSGIPQAVHMRPWHQALRQYLLSESAGH